MNCSIICYPPCIKYTRIDVRFIDFNLPGLRRYYNSQGVRFQITKEKRSISKMYIIIIRRTFVRRIHFGPDLYIMYSDGTSWE